MVDYVPFGNGGELEPILRELSAKKYLLHRGLVDPSDAHMLIGEAANYLLEAYDRVIVAADPAVVDVAQETGLSRALADRLHYVGYVAPDAPDRATIRKHHGVTNSDTWIVCSAGGGLGAEDTMRLCVELATNRPELIFDVTLGPLSKLNPSSLNAPQNCRVQSVRRDLPEMHGSADVAIINGGYNSLMECLVGNARIIVRPNQTGKNTEQITHALKLGKFERIVAVEAAERLETAFDAALQKEPASVKPPLKFYGAVATAQFLSAELNSCFSRLASSAAPDT
ncbi:MULTISPECIES: glycosyltransferase [unclassified Bosea (in: a-proteobacteria)]|uniref:glycosyltransferase n=1 Tax=unclassified Bosea (in: a-proteobacteria) TaxID=2653178 RepID=UPI0013595AE3|nr:MULTISPECIES: glycosyltransferase [unclassified Bosea (in: a-proteobacteria)]